MKTNHFESEQNFYKTLFNGNGKYGINPWSEEPSESMIALLQKHGLIDGHGKRALDVGCGKGRHIAFLKQCGYEVVAVDFSQTALDICKQQFKNDAKVSFKRIDLTTPNCFVGLGQFDLVLQWSVLNHLRAKYVKTYLSNIFCVVKGFLIISEFAQMMGKFKNKPYKVENGHYSRCYESKELMSVFDPLKKVDLIENTDEVKVWN